MQRYWSDVNFCYYMPTRELLRLSVGISDEIEDAMMAIDETKISKIEATKRQLEIIAFRKNISQSDLKQKLNMKIILSHLIHNQTWNVEINALDKKEKDLKRSVSMTVSWWLIIQSVWLMTIIISDVNDPCWPVASWSCMTLCWLWIALDHLGHLWWRSSMWKSNFLCLPLTLKTKRAWGTIGQAMVMPNNVEGTGNSPSPRETLISAASCKGDDNISFKKHQ